MFQALNLIEPRQTWMLRALTCISVNPRKLSAYLRMKCNFFTEPRLQLQAIKGGEGLDRTPQNTFQTKMQLKCARSLPFQVLIGCLVAAVVAAQTAMQLKVFRGTLVHSRVRTEMEVLENYLIGINESNYGTVSRGME